MFTFTTMVVFSSYIFLIPGTLQESGVIQQAYNLNNNMSVYAQSYPSKAPGKTFFSVGNPQVVLETVKKVFYV